MRGARNTLKNRSGFSLGEVVISIAILSTGIVSAVSMLSYSMQLMKTSERHVVANNLARSGIELLRSKRDSNWLFQSGNIRQNWNQGFQEDVTETNYYRIDSTEIGAEFGQEVRICKYTGAAQDNIKELAALLTAPDPELEKYRIYIDQNGLYTHSIGELAFPNEASPYFRQLEISYGQVEAICTAEDCNHIDIKSTVLWFEDGTPQSVVLESQLYDWYERESTEYYGKEADNPCTFA
ncbi:MAG: hypothetical protein PHU71_05870 [Candidatus Gracilibacteria bacterium]|nr:hypothetical protein [Candidatus Gracilibacteria bacterium]